MRFDISPCASYLIGSFCETRIGIEPFALVIASERLLISFPLYSGSLKSTFSTDRLGASGGVTGMPLLVAFLSKAAFSAVGAGGLTCKGSGICKPL